MSRLVWAASCTIRVGEYHIGVRTSTLDVHLALTSAMSEHLVEDPDAPRSYAIHASEPTLDRARPMYRLYHNCNHVFTTPSLERAVAVLAAHLEWYRDRSGGVRSSWLELDTVALVGDGSALLAPWILPYKFPEVELRARRAGRRLLEGRSVLVDPTTAEVIVPPLRLVSASGASPGTDVRTDALDAATPAGRYPVSGWVFLAARSEPTRMSRARAVARAMSLAYRHHPPVDNLRMLAELVNGTKVANVRSIDELLRVVIETGDNSLPIDEGTGQLDGRRPPGPHHEVRDVGADA